MYFKLLLKHSFLHYLISNGVSALISVFLVFFLAKNLSIKEYGLVIFFQAFISGINAVVGSGVSNFCERRYFSYENKKHFSELIIAALNFNFISTLIIFIFILISKKLGFYFENISFTIVFLAMLSAFFNSLISLRVGIWIVKKQSIYFLMFNIFQSCSGILITLLLFNLFNYSAVNRIYSIFIVSLVLFGVAIVSFIKENLYYFKPINFSIVKSIFLEAAGLWPHSIGIFLLFTYDRIYVVSSFGLHEGAIWGFANQMAAILFLFLDGLNKLYAPWLFKSLSSDSEIDRFNINRLTLLIIFLIILFSLGSYFLSDLLIFFIDTKYITSFNILKIMLLTQILSALYYYYVNFIFFKGENKLISIITIISATLYLLLLPFVKTTYGLEGIAWLSLLISLLRIFSLGYTAHIFYPWLSIFQTNKLHESK